MNGGDLKLELDDQRMPGVLRPGSQPNPQEQLVGGEYKLQKQIGKGDVLGAPKSKYQI